MGGVTEPAFYSVLIVGMEEIVAFITEFSVIGKHKKTVRKASGN